MEQVMDLEEQLLQWMRRKLELARGGLEWFRQEAGRS